MLVSTSPPWMPCFSSEAENMSDLSIERNHEAYAASGKVATSAAVRRLAAATPRVTETRPAQPSKKKTEPRQ